LRRQDLLDVITLAEKFPAAATAILNLQDRVAQLNTKILMSHPVIDCPEAVPAQGRRILIGPL
jgi:hypothetical protein